MTIDTERASEVLRSAAIRVAERRILVARIAGSEQEADLSESPNCLGYGRVRHYGRPTSSEWPVNPLPILPAAKHLPTAVDSLWRAQVFQNAACNWRCWYCYVPYTLLSAKEEVGGWFTCDELVNLYLGEQEPAPIIVLSGGQPDLTPEWVPWMMEALAAVGMSETTYLWSDDNLSNDYFWRYLTADGITAIEQYPNYGRVGCFKGYDAQSFAFNTKAEEDLFERQFELFARLNQLSIDLFAYVTFTSPTTTNIRGAMARFVDRLQAVDESLPLRTVPLEIVEFTPTTKRMTSEHLAALQHQWEALEAWNIELEERFRPRQP
jgi:uncharacterized Fe-S cluster-containing radical SAM superfamily protein